MTIVLNGSSGITNDGGYTGDGVSFADTTPANTLVTTTGGNVGIGTSSPNVSYKLHVEGNILATGNLRIEGTQLRVAGTSSAAAPSIQPGEDGDTGMFWPGANIIGFSTAGSERARIDTSGNLLVGQTSASGTATGSTDIYSGGLVINPNNRTSSGSANCVWASSTGQFYRSTSSIKYKQNVEDATYGLADVMQLRPVTYQGKAAFDGEKRFGGFIAEEVDAIGLTEFVVYDEENKPDSLGYDRMVSLLTAAIQEQQAIITALTARVEALEGTQP